VGLIAGLFILQIPLKEFFLWLLKPFRRSNQDEIPEGLKSTSKSGFKLNEGVPIEKGAGKLSDSKDLSQDAGHNALTTVSDPDWVLPGIDLLSSVQEQANPGDVEGNAEIIKATLAEFNIDVEMEEANVGPRVTQYTLKPPAGVHLNRIVALDNELSLKLAAESIRMEAPIPGKQAVGVEVPNKKAASVRIHSIIDSKEWKAVKSPLAFVVGKDIAGNPVVADLDIMPHLLVAGQTGSGKSVMINTLLTSFLYRNSPSDLKMILVDPKRVELKPFDEIPHLLTPVITEPDKTISALKWAVAEMERRYKSLEDSSRRNIYEYNQLKKDERMPYIIIVIDELAELMMMAARDVEALVVRLAQKSRAVGIHLVLATQRPSVNVITGLIKANVPARIAFTTVSQIDSRTIIDKMGAEKLLGTGDMLFSTAQMSKPKRIQGALIDVGEVEKVTDFIRNQRAPEYDDDVVTQPVQLGSSGISLGNDSAEDNLYEEAVQLVVETGKASTSFLQRRFSIGYTRAARLIDMMEAKGVVAAAKGNKPREVLVGSTEDVYGNEEIDI
jgi:S-DNA-T family DNA segregation ATPase FtsK/SpoIIIE